MDKVATLRAGITLVTALDVLDFFRFQLDVSYVWFRMRETHADADEFATRLTVPIGQAHHLAMCLARLERERFDRMGGPLAPIHACEHGFDVSKSATDAAPPCPYCTPDRGRMRFR
jgi:hypothetical protein